ncbi:hypothetical protein AM587_10000070 [Phytophthora nicotianae]|uniref:SWIM-type domain-containing protein n=1 Tax=Phytophthora nicotianae TaxID=4792 RepID=A0A0W8CNT6_PHYNI|nr:hypothetical protein AM587_10000070 [Phytophthora nicotianae]
MIFRDLNRLHFCISRGEYQKQKQRTLAAWRSAFDFCPRFKQVGKSLISQWIEHISSETQATVEVRFSKWQIYHTPPGYAATNNPLEQYHKTLKLVNNTDRATPIELLQRLDRSRTAFIAKNITFNSVAHVSARLKALYYRMKRYGAITGKCIPPVGNLRLARVVSAPWVGNKSIRTLEILESGDDDADRSADDSSDGYIPDNDSGENYHRCDAFSGVDPDQGTIVEEPPHTEIDSGALSCPDAVQPTGRIESDTDTEFHDADVVLPYKSAYTLRMLWDGMPKDGWIVDPASKSCQCRFNAKFAMCLHVIEAAKILGIPCPGMPKPKRKFVNRSQKSQRRKTTNRRPSRRLAQREAGTTGDGANADCIVFGPDLPPARANRFRELRSYPHNVSAGAISSRPLSSRNTSPRRTSNDTQPITLMEFPISDTESVPAFVYSPPVPILLSVSHQPLQGSAIRHSRDQQETYSSTSNTTTPAPPCEISTVTSRLSCDQTKRRRL